jgi:hypothetical protein
LLVDLHRELDGLAPDSPEGREIPSVIIRDSWLRLFVQPFQMPALIDRSTGDPMLFVTDHCRVRDWDALVFLSREISDPVGRLRGQKPGAPAKAMPPLDIPPEAVAEALGQHVRKVYANCADEPLPVLDGKTPREAIQTRQGLEQVKFLLHTYEHGERTQAESQHRPAVSYDFLWRKLGITP